MATTTGVLSAAARRFSRSASSIVTWELSGCHDLTIGGCTTTRKLPHPWCWDSKSFQMGSCSWRIRYQPSSKSSEDGTDDDHISLFLEHVHGETNRSAVAEFKFTLLDQAGSPVPEYSRSSAGLCVFHGEYPRCHAIKDFIKWKDLEESGCLKDGRFAIRCDIVVIESSHDDTAPASPAGGVVVPPSNLHEHLNDLLGKKKGTDVTIDVGGETFNAHGWLLAVRSPVFEAELLAAAKEKVAGGGVRRRMEIQGGMDPQVFKAMLHFMYTDTLPEAIMEEEQDDDVEMARGLLEAAHRYKLERLKLMCEKILCEHIDLNTVAATLAVAEQNDCRALKAACAEFIARPGNLKAVMETEGFGKIKTKCPAVVMELLMKQLA